jgi:hypothetical protein
MESSRAREMENVAVLASILGDGEGFVCKVVLLEGELAEAHRAWEVAEGKVHSLSGSSAEGARRLVVCKMGHRQYFKDLSLLRAWGIEL